MDTTVRDPLEGRLLDGRYSVRSRIARGGMATVYLALDRRLGRDVAVKIMHHHLADDQSFHTRFIREARSAARLSHPNVVQVYDQGSDGDLLYLAMEYLPGRTLREVLAERGVLTPREALTVFEPILDALSAAHRAGIVHRDVKPENVILTDDGRVKVADFGLARGATPSAATTGQLMGTVAYLSPELVTRGVADARSDVYAAGILLFEMLTGCQPFTGDAPIQVAYRHVHEQVPAPSRLVPQLPVQLDDLVLAAAANDPDRRPDSAGELLAMVRLAHAELPPSLLDVRPRRPVPGAVPPAAEVVRSAGPATDGRTTALAGAAPQHTRPLPGVTRSGRRAAGQHDAGQHDAGQQQRSSEAGRDGEDATLRELARQRRRRGRMGLAVVLMLTVALGGVAWWFTAGPGAFRTVPPLTGLTLAEAKQQLSPLSLDAEPRYQHDEITPPGRVITTTPQTGQEIRRGSGVVLVISDGPPRVGVPDVAGLTADQAAEKLAAGYLKTGSNRDWQFDDVAPKGNVISTDPPADSQVDNGSTVTLTISKGPQPVDLPDMSGRRQDDAHAQLQGLGFKPGITQEFSDTVPAGTVIGQEPHAGPASHGQSVQLTVSKGPELFDVPDVFGKNVNDATKILSDAGFQVQTNKIMGGPFGLVRQQNPGAHSQQPKGTLITLTVV